MTELSGGIDPPHGTRAAYWRGCRCLPCRAARNAYQRNLRQRRPLWVSADAARAHLKTLRAIGYRRIAHLAQLSPSQVHEIRSGRATRIQRETERRILAVTPSKANGALVSSWRTRRLLSAIRSEGWTKGQIAQMVRRGAAAFRCDGEQVRVGTQSLVEHLYLRLSADDYDWRAGKRLE